MTVAGAGSEGRAVGRACAVQAVAGHALPSPCLLWLLGIMVLAAALTQPRHVVRGQHHWQCA